MISVVQVEVITIGKINIEDRKIHKRLMELGYENHIAWHIISQIDHGLANVKKEGEHYRITLTNYDCNFILN